MRRSTRCSRRPAACRTSSTSATASRRRRRWRMWSGCWRGCGAVRRPDFLRCFSGGRRALHSSHPERWPVLENLYPWIKAFHVIALIAWMAGMLYLPRLFVYHASLPPGPGSAAQSATFKVMERRLLKAIMNPAMIVTWVLGLTLAWTSGAYVTAWLQAKFVLVLAMTGIHGWLGRMVKDFSADRN